jgi:glycosyltransferase involved in cell wall biosynthesis
MSAEGLDVPERQAIEPQSTPRAKPARRAPEPALSTNPIEEERTAREALCKRGVTIVVPIFNEVRGVAGVVERLARLELGVPLELLAVNDGSQDGTGAVLEGLKAALPALRIVTHTRNMGYGAALKTGFAYARHDVVVITDADGTYPEDRIAELLARIDDGAEMAVGARLGEDVHIPATRRPAKWLLRKLASFLAGTDIPDLNSGLRAIRRDLVLRYRQILPQGFSFTTTITLAALTNGHRVDYVSISYAKREGRSKIRPLHDTLAFTSLIVRTVLYFNPLKVFYPVSLGLLVLFLGSLAYDLFFEPRPNLGDKTVLLFVAAVQVLTVGLLADLIEKKSRL